MEEILKAIKEALKKAGINEKYADRVQKLSKIEKVEDVDSGVTLFKENVLPEIIDAEKEAAKTARKKAVEDYEKKHNLKGGKSVKTEEENDDDDNDNDDDIDIEGMDEKTKAFFKKQNKAISDLTDVVSKMVKTQMGTNTLQTVREKLKGKIDEKFIDKYAKRVNLEADDLDAEIENAVKEFTDDKQLFLNEAISSGNYTPASGSITDKDFDDYAKRTEDKDSEFEGRKI